MDEITEIMFLNRQEWRKWLEINHDKSNGIWMVYYKKHTKKESIGYSEAVEEALCFGWIDSVIKSIDHEKYKQKYTPRRKNSIWSQVNKDRVEKLIKESKMTLHGLLKVDDAKKNGEWDKAYSLKLKTEIPEDLKSELQKNEIAWQNFINFTESSQTLFKFWLSRAKRTETREKRIKEIVKLASQNRKLGIV